MAESHSEGARSPEQVADLNANEQTLIALLRRARRDPSPHFQAAVLSFADRVERQAAAHPNDAAVQRFAKAFRRYVETAVIEARRGVQ